ncbi:MAG: DMT family transporter [Planktomarina temperata]|nr:DMT family transporter [Planktomarina temperata]
MNDDKRGIIFIFIGMSLFSIQDILVRKLSDVGSLIQVMTIRGLVGGLLLIWFLRATGRTVSIKSAYPKLAVIRVFIFFCGFLCFYFALGEMELAEVTSLFFFSPIFVTLISKFVFKNEIGFHRLCAVITGFVGVILIVKPSPSKFELIALLPLVSALTYSVSMMIANFTRDRDTVWQQMMHMYWGSCVLGGIVSITIAIFGDNLGHSKSLVFLLRPWVTSNIDALLMISSIAIVGSGGMLLLTSAYRIANPSLIAPFEYVLLILAIANGYWFFSEVPDYYSFAGMVLITLSGVYIFFREGIRKEPLAVETSLRT